MYNPLPYLPEGFKKIIRRLKSGKINSKVILILIGALATLWFLIRVIPKPSRAGYPCMKATAPFMSAFVIYILSLGGTALTLKAFRHNLKRSKYSLATMFLVLTACMFLITQSQVTSPSYAKNIKSGEEYFTPNTPIGEAQGIFPGRVVWMWNKDATNETCTNTSNSNGIVDVGDDGWFMDINNDPAVIDSMLTKSLLALTGEKEHPQAWDKIFRYYNSQKGNGDTGYVAGQKILLKTNATTAYGAPGDNYDLDLRRNDKINENAFAAETNPFLVLSMLDQLVNVAGVPEEMIYVGDPARNTYKFIYDLWHASFPSVNYLGNNLIHPDLDITAMGRTPVASTENDKMFYSDDGQVMTDAISDKLFTIFDDIDYLINIPTMKAHSTAGITLAAKNHFGSFTRTWAMHLHDGLMKNSDNPERVGYGLYRVQTDIMMHKLLSGKNLFMIVDALYPGEDALGVPEKWTSSPFDNDWCSSLFVSFDPVAIESVCHDFLRTEYNGPTYADSRPNWHGVDDYLHQAADSALWPNGVIYDPDDDGILISSLGVHEHWNDAMNKKYTRNLETGNGIELIKVHESGSGIDNQTNQDKIRIYPNPTSDYITISNPDNSDLDYSIVNLEGREMIRGKIQLLSNHEIDISHFADGIYILSLRNSNIKQDFKIIKH